MRKQRTNKPKTKKSNPILAFRVDAKTLAAAAKKCGGLPELQQALRSVMEGMVSK